MDSHFRRPSDCPCLITQDLNSEIYLDLLVNAINPLTEAIENKLDMNGNSLLDGGVVHF